MDRFIQRIQLSRGQVHPNINHSNPKVDGQTYISRPTIAKNIFRYTSKI